MGKAILLDGATGTMLWKMAGNNIPVWRYNIENPEIVYNMHKEYINAGSQIIFSNTFSANRDALKRYDRSVNDVVSEGVRIAKEAVKGTNTKVFLDVGPLTVLLEPYGDLEEDEALEIYEEQIGAGMKMHPDGIQLETFMDVELMKIAVRVAKKYDVPVFSTMTFEAVGKTLMGNSVETIVEELTELGVDGMGLNCSLGPKAAIPVIKRFLENTDKPVIFKPNAGLPTSPNNEPTEADALIFANDVYEAVKMGVGYVGGCCGSNPTYIKKLKELIEKG